MKLKAILSLIVFVFASNSIVAQCNCKCGIYIKKIKNKRHSPLFDSTKFQTRSWPIGYFAQSNISFTLIHDSIDYLGINVYQKFNFRQTVTLHIGQTIMFQFFDSTNYSFKIGEDLQQRDIPNTYIKTSDFKIVFTDSLKNLLLTKMMSQIWFNNQKTLENVEDRVYISGISLDFYKKYFCCFDERKRVLLKLK